MRIDGSKINHKFQDSLSASPQSSAFKSKVLSIPKYAKELARTKTLAIIKNRFTAKPYIKLTK